MDNEKKDDKDRELGLFLMFEKCRQWFDTWDVEKEDRAEALSKLSKWSGLPEKSPVCLMMLAFCAGADAGADFILKLEKEIQEP